VSVKFLDPKRREERVVVKAISRPPFPFFDIGERGGYAHELERRQHAAGAPGGIGAAVSALSPCRSGSGGSDGGIAAALGTVGGGGGVRTAREAGTARRLQALVGSATACGDDVERAR